MANHGHFWEPGQYRVNGQVQSSTCCRFCGEGRWHANHVPEPTPSSEEKEAEYRRLAQELAMKVWRSSLALSNRDQLQSLIHAAIVRFYAEEKQ